MKPLHRMILLSSVYRQASESPMDRSRWQQDAENSLLWKSTNGGWNQKNPDSMLVISGS